MLVYRLASRKFSVDNSEGASRFGGRWNNPGTPVIYASATRSLAALEVIVHNGAIPADYRIVIIELPDDLAIENVELKSLPDGWPDGESEPDTATSGTEWASSLRTAVLRVPSAAIRAEHNYIVNPLHPDFKTIRFHVSAAEYIDSRLQTTMIRQLIQTLDKRDRDLLRAVFLTGRDIDEACKDFGVDRDHLRVLLDRAKAQFGIRR
jgi:RES domain-containing protein